jgi:hypothetical protein
MVPGSHPMEKMQSTFQCTIEQDHVTARSNLGPTFQKQKLSVLLQGRLVDHMYVNCEEDANDPEYEADDIQNIYADGLDSDIDWDPQGPQLPPHKPLKGYEYTPFRPTDTPRQFTGHIRTSPTIKVAQAALTDLKPLLRPKQQTGSGYKDPDLDLWTR